jgi:phosphoglycolate phosphatase-like HAD superfamily hydrolase
MPARDGANDVGAALARFGLVATVQADGALCVAAASTAWLAQALPALGVACAVAADGGLRIAPVARPTLLAAVATALRPGAVLLDLDGVLADIERRVALAPVAAVAALAQRVPLGVVTTCPRRLAESVLARHGFAPFVQTVVGVEDAAPKPDPAPVRLAMRRLAAATAWMVGDNPSDVLAARGAGVLALAIAPHGLGAASHAAALREAGVARLVPDLDVVATLLPQPVGPVST